MAKNSEVYKTAQERTEAFQLHCKSLEGKCRADMSCDECRFAWLDLEAEEEKPLPCPFCGGEVFSQSFSEDEYLATCRVCGYTGKIFTTKNEAIAAHNRVAKAVKESEEKE